MLILGINEFHNSTACLLKDDEIVACVSEERFTRNKNEYGWPQEAVKWIMREYQLTAKDIDVVAISFINPLFHFIRTGQDDIVKYKPIRSLFEKIFQLSYHFKFIWPIYNFLHQNLWQKLAWPGLQRKRFRDIKNLLQVENNKILLMNHHLAHAYAPFYGLIPDVLDKDVLIFTCDAAGDDSCANIYLKTKNGELKNLATTPNYHSLGSFYGSVTQILGMKPFEHEYKVMGLAPYADQDGVKMVYEVLKQVIWLDEDSLCFRAEEMNMFLNLKRKLDGYRFDWIAGAAQKHVEDLLLKWVKLGIAKTGIKTLAFGGGVFMNVKANQKILELPEVEQAYFMPSSGDESTAIGAAYYAAEKITKEKNQIFIPKLLRHLYLGPEYSDDEINKSIDEHDLKEKYHIEEFNNIEKEVAKLLAAGKAVARFNGRMEWGARALGNRSILANPQNMSIIRIINDKIKNRDFWMPFAGSILAERADDYLVNPKNAVSSYMILTFDTTTLAKKEMLAATHPYDFTSRPQVVEREVNPSYYQLIKEFEQLTGIGAILNTSFNLHGYPIVCSPIDAFKVMDNSGLNYLAIGNFLLTKKELESDELKISQEVEHSFRENS